MGKTTAGKSTARAKQTETKRTSRGGARKPSKNTGRAAIRTFASAMTFLNSHTNYERMLRPSYNKAHFNLSRMLRLLSAMGNPHKQLPAIHIAGTKGKGSTCAMVAAILQQAGFRVGLYTSPHINNIRERIAVNGKMISESEFAKLVAEIAPAVKKIEKDGPTFFDIMTAIAMQHFANQEVDFAILETGLGGRLDSTNVCKPVVCGITNISLDHMAQLGNTAEKIAEEKAGIFKQGVPVITTSEQREGVLPVLRSSAEKVGSELRVVGEDLEFSFRFESSRLGGPQNRVCMATPRSRFDHLQVPLVGEHQAHNCGIALGIVDALREQGYEISPEDVIDGLAKTQIEGRCEVIRDLPLTVIDAAHNAESITALMRAIGQSFNYDSMVLIFGCSSDKDVDGMLDQLRLGADKVIFTNIGSPRSMDPKELLQRFQERTQKMAQSAETLEEAYQIARRCVSRDDLICITGSIYLIGEAKQKMLAGALE